MIISRNHLTTQTVLFYIIYIFIIVRVKYNGKTEGATVNVALTFVGKYTSDVVPYIFDTMTDQSLREVYNGKLIFGIGGVYFTNFEVTSVIVWINTHEVKSPVLTRRNGEYPQIGVYNIS